MTFTKLQNILEEKFGANRLADIAKEFDVTPQVVSNWKSRDQVPYKYVRILRKKIDKLENSKRLNIDQSNPFSNIHESRYSLEGAIFPSESEISIQELMEKLFNDIVENLKLFLTIPVVVTAITAVHVQYFVEPVFISNLKFLPIESEKSTASKVQGIASSFGFDIGGGSSNSSLSSANMYPEIIKSRTLAKYLLKEKFFSEKMNKILPLFTIMSGGDSLNNKDSSHAINYLATSVLQNISVHKPRGTNLLTLTVKSSEPKLSADIALSVINLVNEIQKRFQSKSINEKRFFIESRMAEVSLGLSKAEEHLKLFRESNRSVMSSPSLMLEQSRLLREVEVQTQIYITLKSQYELVKIEEIGNANSVEILDPPEVPLLRSLPNKKFRVFVSLFLSILFSTIVIFLIGRYNIKKNIFGFLKNT